MNERRIPQTILTVCYGHLEEDEKDTKVLLAWLGANVVSQFSWNLNNVLFNLSEDLDDMRQRLWSARYAELLSAVGNITRWYPGLVSLRDGWQEVFAGNAETALVQFRQADKSRPFLRESTDVYLKDQLAYARLYIAFVTDEVLTRARIDASLRESQSWFYRRKIIRLRCLVAMAQQQFTLALDDASYFEQLGRNAGIRTPPVLSALALAMIGRAEEASVAIEDCYTEFDRIPPSRRDHYHLAQALMRLNRPAEAAAQARAAYAQAWAEGPPYSYFWDLRDARQLLESMGQPLPDLPTVDPATVKVPFEDEVRARIAELKAEQDQADQD